MNHPQNQTNEPQKPKSPARVLITTIAAVLPLIALLAWLQMQPEQTPHAPPGSTSSSSSSSSRGAIKQLSSSVSSEVSSKSSSSQAKIEVSPPPAPKKPKLPSLNDSDPAIKTSLSQANGQALLPLLSQEFILRKAVRAIALMAEGGLVTQYRPLNSPIEPFKKGQKGDELFIATENFKRYEPYLSAAESIGADALVGLYKLYYPLLEEANKELGSKSQKSFKTLTIDAIDLLLASPKTHSNISLKQPSVMYLYSDKSLEGLPQAQKLMLRIGPKNQARLKALLQDIKSELGH